MASTRKTKAAGERAQKEFDEEFKKSDANKDLEWLNAIHEAVEAEQITGRESLQLRRLILGDTCAQDRGKGAIEKTSGIKVINDPLG